MWLHQTYDAIIVGSGPNGLSAAIVLAQAGYAVLVVEARDTIGGGTHSQELTLPGCIHDVCSAIHPLGYASPFFRSLPLERYGLEWIQPPIALAHPLDNGTTLLLQRSITDTSAQLGPDAHAYTRLMMPLVKHWDTIVNAFMGPLRLSPLLHPLALAPFALCAIRSARGLAEQHFRGEQAQALLAGMAGHSMLPLERLASAAAGLMLMAAGHIFGWPFPRGGSQKLADALAAYLCSLGGEIVTGLAVENVDALPPSRAILCDVTPRQFLEIAGHHFPEHYKRSLQRYRYGPGAFKMDFALSDAIPWQSRLCSQAGTVHLGGTFGEIATSERQVWQGQPPDYPFVLVAQQSLFDSTRAPEGMHTAWAYCHVPHGSTFDMTDRIEAQIERFAPGFRDCILARHVLAPADLANYNANYIGGDINGGVQDIWQLFTRPTFRFTPYATPAKNIFLCSSSTPPGGGVHGLCGYFAAQAALRFALA